MVSSDNIIIKNGIIKLMQYSPYQKEQVATKTWKFPNAESFLNTIQGTDLILPEGVRYFRKYADKRYLFVIETPPVERTINLDMSLTYRWTQFRAWCRANKHMDGIDYFADKFRTKKFSYGHYSFGILSPYIIYTMYINQQMEGITTKIYASGKPIRDLTDMLYIAPFYNISSGEYVCMPRAWASPGRNINDCISETLSNFWSTDFNSDYNGCMKRYKDIRHLSNYFVWEYLTKTDPFFLLERFRNDLLPKRTLKDAIQGYERSNLRGHFVNQIYNIMPPSVEEVKQANEKKKAAEKKLP